FSKLSKSIPYETAIIFENKKISFSQLDQMSNSLAHFLREYGIKSNDIVPIICERTYFYIIAAFAIMKAGGAFVFIDPEFPNDRINYMIEEVNPKIILKYHSDKNIHLKLKYISSVYQYDLQSHNYDEHTEYIENINKADDTCYIFFTSGTTGKPKGVLISHDNLAHYCIHSQTQNGVNCIYDKEYKKVLAFTQFTYAMIVIEIYYNLLKGKTLVLCNNKEYNDPELLGQLINKYEIEFLVSTPSRINNYLSNIHFKESIKKVKIFNFSGEPITNNFIKSLRLLTNEDIYVGLGLTEATAYCALSKVTADDIKNEIITIGHPTCNYKFYILDNDLKPVPIGVKGEIYIGGYSISKGYLNREELTSQRFIDNHIDPSSKTKLYKTGDIGRWTKDGRIVYIGRSDFQVKIRGQRVELPEIENTIMKYPEIDYVIVIYKNNNINNYLLCYYKTNSNKELNENDLKEFVSKQLPSYMCPNYYMRLNEIPLSPSGKLNRKALPEIDISKIS
ncbi:acetyl-CoA synthetase-like protein, partial [Anaeromyces robustus]